MDPKFPQSDRVEGRSIWKGKSWFLPLIYRPNASPLQHPGNYG